MHRHFLISFFFVAIYPSLLWVGLRDIRLKKAIRDLDGVHGRWVGSPAFGVLSAYLEHVQVVTDHVGVRVFESEILCGRFYGDYVGAGRVFFGPVADLVEEKQIRVVDQKCGRGVTRRCRCGPEGGGEQIWRVWPYEQDLIHVAELVGGEVLDGELFEVVECAHHDVNCFGLEKAAHVLRIYLDEILCARVQRV